MFALVAFLFWFIVAIALIRLIVAVPILRYGALIVGLIVGGAIHHEIRKNEPKRLEDARVHQHNQAAQAKWDEHERRVARENAEIFRRQQEARRAKWQAEEEARFAERLEVNARLQAAARRVQQERAAETDAQSVRETVKETHDAARARQVLGAEPFGYIY